MKRNLALLAISASVLFSFPYLFYASMFQGLGFYLWKMLCLLVFVVLTYRWRNEGRNRLTALVVGTSLGVSLPTLMVVSIVETAVVFVIGVVVYGLFAWGAANLGRQGLASG